MASTRRRVKLYTLNEDRQWDDRGTGHVSSSYVERLQGMSIMVRSEEDGSILLESKIQPHTAYQKQQETLIVWSEGDNYDLALSFQEKAGCDEIWEKICQIQGKDPSVTITQDIPEDDDSEERFEEVLDSTGPIELPACELSKLDEIAELFNSVLPSPIRREKLALAIEQDNYIRKMLDLFHICEDLENLEGLHHLYDIFKSLFFMNKPSLLEIMLADDLVFDVVGCLEYDPSKPAPQRHRLFLKESANFKEIIPITNSDIINKIHQTYRVQYIYDAILPPPSVFDDNLLASVNSFILFNRIEIATHLQKKNLIPTGFHNGGHLQEWSLREIQLLFLFDPEQEDDKFLADMFLQLTDEDTLEERRKQLVSFLRELVGFSLHLQLHQKDEFFKALAHHGLLPALEMLLVSDSEEHRLASVEMFSQVVDISPYLVRDFIMKEAQTQEEVLLLELHRFKDLVWKVIPLPNKDMLMNHMIDYMICDGDTGNAYQLSQLIRTLLDPENMALGANKMEKSEFLSFFYKHSMHVMTAPLFATTCDDKPSRDDYVNSVTLGHILELLTFCIEHHTYHIKNYVISKDLLRRVLVLMKSRHKFLVLNSLRFLRRIVGLKDEFYNRYIVKGQLFDPVVSAFKENGQRYNLLNSAIVELFEFIRVEDMKSLCSHVCTKYMQFFTEVTYVSTFKGLLQRDEQEQDRKQQNNRILDGRGGINHGIIHVNSRFRRDVRTLDEDEEHWFEQEDENGEESVIIEQTDLLNDDSVFKNRKSFVSEKPPPSIVNNKRPLVGLVDYPDDEDEDEDDDAATSPAKRARLNAS